MAKSAAETKEQNRISVKEYHAKLTDIKVRIPSAETAGVDYLQLIKDRALQLGYASGKNADKPNVNAYILALVSADLGVEVSSSVKD